MPRGEMQLNYNLTTSMKPLITIPTQLGRAAFSIVVAVGLTCALAQPALADLTHRYSFITDAMDSVGTAHGTPVGFVSFTGGEAVFPGTAGTSGTATDYIELPPGLISNYTAVTFEFWASPGPSGVWSELFAFGNTNNGVGANMLMFTPKSGADDYRMSYGGADPGYTDEHVATGGGYLDNLGPLSIACVYDPANNRMSLYKNGLLVSTLSPVTAALPARQFSLTNVHNVYSWLGRSFYNGDALYNGTIDEFRIYNAPLDPVQIAINHAAGPNTIVTNFTLTGGSWNVNTNMIVGERQDAAATLNYLYNGTQVGSATIVSLTDPVYSSSDTNVVTVTPSGRLFAMAPGSATVSAVYLGQTFSSVVYVAATPKLLHRYSFTADANDSVGTAHAALMGGATITGGAVALSGTGTSASPGDYVDFPNDLFSNVTSVTIETWVTQRASGNWARIWDFGNSVGGEDTSAGGGNNLFLSSPSGAGTLRASINIGSGEQIVDAGTLVADRRSYVVYVADLAHRTASLYVDGALAGRFTGLTLAPSDLGYTRNNWMGRAQYNDPMYNGLIDEFRIWQGAFSPINIAINAASGPDTLGPADPGPVQALHLTIAPSMIKGGVQQAAVTADFAGITGVNAASLGVVYTSGNTNVVTVSPAGLISAVGIGSTTVMAELQGKTDSKPVTVVVKPTVLAHRWSFNETTGTTADDSIGTADGMLGGSAAFSGSGTVTLNGVDGFVDMPGDLMAGYDAVTFEIWATVNSATLNNTDSRLFVFGSAHAVNEVGLTARTGGNNTFLRYFGPTTVTVLAGGHLGVDRQLHVVGIFNPPQGTIDLFIDGSWQNSVTNIGFSLASITNTMSRLGVNLATNVFTAADINEFRLYNGALDLLGIRASFAAGPDALATNLGTATALTLEADPGMVQGSKALPHVRASFASAADVDLTDTMAVTFTSSDSAVLAITPDGLVQAVGTGTATLTASYGGRTANQDITVYPKQAMLVHRYSFTADATDSVGVQDGVLWNSAQITGGKVMLFGDATSKSSYVELPKRLVSTYDAVTMECWATLPTIATWARVYDFGSQTSGAGGETYIFLTRTGTPGTRSVLKDLGAEAILDSTTALLDNFSGQIAVVYDPPSNTQTLYTNGVLVGSGSLNGKVMAGVNDLHCWIGKSLYSADPGLTGDIDEFRIYAGALTPAQIAASSAAGPDTVALPPPVAAGPKLTVVVSGSTLVITWPSSATGYTVQTSSNLASWSSAGVTPVIVGQNYQVTVPVAAGPAFYRLMK